MISALFKSFFSFFFQILIFLFVIFGKLSFLFDGFTNVLKRDATFVITFFV